MSSNLRLVTTADGSNTLWNEAVGEHYHSRHGALQESKHVFLHSGLEYYLSLTEKRELSILEVGFGTGLNFLLSADYCAKKNITLNYTGIEAYPVDPELLGGTGYEKFLESGIWEAFLSVYPEALKKEVKVNELCSLQIHEVMLSDFKTGKKFDLLYFDAFAAVHQPEMWTEEALFQCCQYLVAGGVFVTYAITGNLKRTMKKLGFKIEKAPGAPGKREMLRATKL